MTSWPLFVDADLAPGSIGPTASQSLALWRTFPLGVEGAVFGALVPGAIVGHDHGARGGEPLSEPLVALTFGPAGTGSASGWTQGLPVLPPAAGSGLSFAATPKLLACARVLLRGGVDTVTAEALLRVEGASPRSLSLRLVLRRLRDHGLSPEAGDAARATLSSGSLTGAARETRASATFADLGELGDPAGDRDALLEVWLTTDLPAGDSARLLVLALFGARATSREPVVSDPVATRAELLPAEVLPGGIVYARHAETAQARLGQVVYQVLGSAPGLAGSLDLPDRSVAWERGVTGPHQHRGRRFTDPDSGAVIGDGAVVRRPLWSQSFAQDLDEVAGEFTNARPPAGLRLHPSGALSLAAGWALVEGRLAPPQGLRAALFQVAVAPETPEHRARLWVRLRLLDLAGDDVLFTVEGGEVDPQKASGATRVLLGVLDGPAWQPSLPRLLAGLGVWTEAAARAPLPATVPTTERLARVSAPLRLSWSERPRTEDLRLRVQFELETGEEGSGVYSIGASLLWADLLTPDGY